MGARVWRWGAAGLMALALACGGEYLAPAEPSDGTQEGGEHPPEAETPDMDAGTPEEDPGTPEEDPGTPEPDAGTPEPEPIILPRLEGWRFYGPEEGAPQEVLGVTEDQGGNLWVAGGEEGLFLLRPGHSSFERFTMEDGLRPYGYLSRGRAPEGPKYLKVLSVAGGPPGTVFVGYEGQPGCESNYYLREVRDPNIYKSGDADKVTLTDSGIQVVHYDISSGPGVVSEESGAREKLCSVLRIAYDAEHGHLWFGANHGFAWGDPDYLGDPLCGGRRECSGVYEHAHPHINARDETGHVFRLTDAYYGVAVLPDGDVWFGGANRSTRFRFMTNRRGPRNFEQARVETESRSARANRVDLWSDLVDELAIPGPQERVDDLVSGLAAMPDGTLWAGSFGRGLALIDGTGQVLRYALSEGPARYVSAVVRDTRDDSLWVGHRWGGGLTRLRGDSTLSYGPALGLLAGHPVYDLQVTGTGPGRRLWVAFGRSGQRPGLIGLYEGE